MDLLSREQADYLRSRGIGKELFSRLLLQVTENRVDQKRVGLHFRVEGFQIVGVTAWWEGRDKDKEKAKAVYEVLSEMTREEIAIFFAN